MQASVLLSAARLREFAMKLLSGAILPAIVIAAGLGIGIQSAAIAEIHWHRTCNRCTIPKHNYGHDNPRGGVTGFAVANAVVERGSLILKPFHFRAIALKLDHLSLDQVGLAIDKAEGRLIASGRITHDGGDGGLIGSNVVIRIRAYAASSADTVQIPPDAVVVWDTETSLWVPRGQKHISLTPALEKQNRLELQRNFDIITHLEVEMEYSRDR